MTGSTSPRISDASWGRIVVDGRHGYKDAKLWPGGSREWDWRETGTRHSPGIQPADVDELLDHGATTIVLSRGMLRRLAVPAETLEYLRARGVEIHVLPTKEAIDLYNRLRESEPVGGLFHSTC